ncbi:helix-turn-helix domain-containing protein [Urechidicola croceus]|uniref:HTH araC/xylS-type domain-containing protein n=1 Tax=Urechidicola croceus TaxID=1850246 RepID=A0A1D8P9X3_9FLAO|nr:AraC family transcriptional regulator [Urechidicola croceus]AOW21291.1 hypothetical protein LPB138_11645 [Urechidicola croceus]
MNIRLSLLLFLLIKCFASTSQNQNNGSLTTKTFNELSKEFYHIYYDSILDTKKANVYANEYLNRAKKEKDTIKIANGFQYKSNLSDFENAIKYVDSILLYTQNIQNIDYPALGYMLKGAYYFNHAKGKDKEALDFLLMAHEYALKNNNLYQQLYIKEAIGKTKLNFGDYNGALVIFKEQQKLIENQPQNERKIIDILVNNDDLTKAFIRARELDSASKYNKKNIHLSLKNNNRNIYYGSLLNQGAINYFGNNFKTALDSLSKVEPFISGTSLVVCYYYKGKIHQESNLKKTVYYFNKIDSIYQKTNDPIIELTDVYRTLVEYHESQNNINEQFSAINKLIKVDSVLNNYIRHIDAQITSKYEIPILKKESNRLKNQLKENSKKSKSTIYILSSVTLLSLLLGFNFFQKQKKYRERFDDFQLNENLMLKIEKENNHTCTNQELDISTNVVQDIMKKLDLFESQNEFLKNNLTLYKISKDFKTNSSYLSKVINRYKNNTFSQYLNELRLNYCIQQLNSNNQFRSYTIKAIAEEVGFNTPESFSKAFYKKTGVYPSFFIKQLNKNE